MTPPPTRKQINARRHEVAYRLAALALERYNNTPEFWRNVNDSGLHPNIEQSLASNIIRDIAKELSAKAEKYRKSQEDKS